MNRKGVISIGESFPGDSNDAVQNKESLGCWDVPYSTLMERPFMTKRNVMEVMHGNTTTKTPI